MELNTEQLADRLVGNHVLYCTSYLVSELSKDEKHQDELLEILVNYSEDEEEPQEALEHWIVSDWLADKLAEENEMVTKDFLGLTIWGRTTSGQSVSMDYVIQKIAKENS